MREGHCSVCKVYKTSIAILAIITAIRLVSTIQGAEGMGEEEADSVNEADSHQDEDPAGFGGLGFTLRV